MPKSAALSLFLSLLKGIWILFKICIKVLLIAFIIAEFVYGDSKKTINPDNSLLERLFAPSQ